MTSAQHPNRVYFSSFDRSPVDTNTDFTITFDTPIDKAKNFEVVSASFPNSFHQFAPYETVFYFYHEDFNGGNIAIGVPLSITQFLGIGATGENAVPSARPTGRKQYIDGRYFLDGADVATYITAWIQSLSATGGTDFPASSTGLCPFYHINDDTTQPIVYFANEAATGVNFSQLSLTYDDTTSAGGEGSLKMLFEDATPKVVRVASAIDVGVLDGTYLYPSLLGYKLGFTDLIHESFGAQSVAAVGGANNQFTLMGFWADGNAATTTITIPPNDYTLDGLAAAIETAINNNPTMPINIFSGTTVTQAAGVLTFTVPGIPTVLGPIVQWIIRFTLDPVQLACKTLLGFGPQIASTSVAPGTPIVAPTFVTTEGVPTPDPHVAPDPIDLIRTSNIYFASSLSAGEALSSAGRKDILFSVSLTAPVGGVQLYQSSLSGIIVNRPPDVIRNLRLTLLDDNFQVMEPMPQNSAVSVEIHFAYADENMVNNVSTNPYAY